MFNFAAIKDGVVVNTLVADSKEIAETVTGLECVEYEESVHAGFLYQNNTFVNPLPPSKPFEPPKITEK